MAGDTDRVRRLGDRLQLIPAVAWRRAGVFEALLEGLIAEAVRRGEVDLSLVCVDSTTACADQDATGMHLAWDAPGTGRPARSTSPPIADVARLRLC